MMVTMVTMGGVLNLTSHSTASINQMEAVLHLVRVSVKDEEHVLGDRY